MKGFRSLAPIYQQSVLRLYPLEKKEKKKKKNISWLTDTHRRAYIINQVYGWEKNRILSVYPYPAITFDN